MELGKRKSRKINITKLQKPLMDVLQFLFCVSIDAVKI